ncbi:MAG: hypothetical protein NTX11_00120 [Candidatus Saccharibacteria bacterium]|nr:hypothetical protein [Candidatus Saccharibacteria bacterium]
MNSDQTQPKTVVPGPSVGNSSVVLANSTPAIVQKYTEESPGSARLKQGFSLIAAIAVSFLSGYLISSAFLSKQQPGSTAVTQVGKSTSPAVSAPIEQTNDPATLPGSSPTPSTPGGSQIPAPPPVPNEQPSEPVYCGVKGIPQAACQTLESIENEGLKNNKYIAVDTSSIPAGTKVTFNKKTWSQAGPEIGSVEFSFSYSGKSYVSTASMQQINNVWKIVSFTKPVAV